MSTLPFTHRAAFGRIAMRRSRLRRPVTALGAVVLFGALALGGLCLGTRLSTPGSYPSALGTASFQVRLSDHGGIEVYIPLADWGLRASPMPSTTPRTTRGARS